MNKEDYKPKYFRNTMITLLIIAIVVSFSYFVVIRKINYNLGERYYLARIYPDAIKKLKPLGNYQDSKSLYIRSLYRQGELFYFTYNYKMAIDNFEELAIILPETKILVTDAIYMMAVHEGVNKRYASCITILKNNCYGYAKYYELLDAARAEYNKAFVLEHRNHVIALNYREVIGYYLNSK
ncbi:MAG: hypothetical protein KAG94_01525 [Clostridiales bacterium]|nr:hypothetical protein [Clostridiales bacterium]